MLMEKVSSAVVNSGLGSNPGVIALNKFLGKVLAETEVRVNCVARTFLASRECSFNSGAVFDISGVRATY
jgi:hypothetical protein